MTAQTVDGGDIPSVASAKRLPESLHEVLLAEPSAFTPERRLLLRGTVLRRKILSRCLAFCTLKLEACAEVGGVWLERPLQSLHGVSITLGAVVSGAVASGVDQCAPGDATAPSQVATCGLCFMSSLLDVTGESFSEEEGSWCESSGAPLTANDWAAFPETKGRLQVGARVEASVFVASSIRCDEALVRRWRKLPEAGMGVPIVDLAWHHASRDAVNATVRKELRSTRHGAALCKVWRQRCKCADDCSFRHHFASEEEASRAAELEEARSKSKAVVERERSVYNGDADHGDKAAKSRRAERFALWLLEQYGEGLSGGSGVLDVAGGRGDLTWKLSVDHNVPCTLVDPRLRRGGELKSWQRRVLRKTGKDRFKHVALEFDQRNFLDGLTDHAELLNQASLVVGLHPDEATEPIVDMSLRSGRKFAVVPCCVFPDLFPRECDGVPVRTLNQFCEYLRRKDSRIQEALLDFEGRNKVLFIP